MTSKPAIPTYGQVEIVDRRYRLVEDDDGHWYCIQVGQEKEFDRWEAAGPYWEGYEGFDFNDVRLDGSPSNVTFTNPEY